MRCKRTLFVALALVLGCLATAPIGCFSLQQPTCAFTCVDPPHLCPANYTCGTDFLCHRDGTTVMCVLSPPVDGGLDSDAGDPDDAAD